MSKGTSICVKVYLKPDAFAEICELAEKAGVRRRGLLLYTQKEHGMADEKLANTDKLAKFFKYCVKYYKDTESSRLARAAELARKEKELQEEKKKLGMI